MREKEKHGLARVLPPVNGLARVLPLRNVVFKTKGQKKTIKKSPRLVQNARSFGGGVLFVVCFVLLPFLEGCLMSWWRPQRRENILVVPKWWTYIFMNACNPFKNTTAIADISKEPLKLISPSLPPHFFSCISVGKDLSALATLHFLGCMCYQRGRC